MDAKLTMLKSITHKNLAKKIIAYGKTMVTDLKKQNNQSLIPNQKNVINDIIKILISHYEGKKVLTEPTIDFIGCDSEEITADEKEDDGQVTTEVNHDTGVTEDFEVKSDDINELKTKFNLFVKHQLDFNEMILKQSTDKDKSEDTNTQNKQDKGDNSYDRHPSRQQITALNHVHSHKPSQRQQTKSQSRPYHKQNSKGNQNKTGNHTQTGWKGKRESDQQIRTQNRHQDYSTQHSVSPAPYQAPIYPLPANFQYHPGYYGPPSPNLYPNPYPYPQYR